MIRCERLARPNLETRSHISAVGVQRKKAQLTGPRQLILNATEENSLVHFFFAFSIGGITDRLSDDVSQECAPIGAGLHTSTFKEATPPLSKAVHDHREMRHTIPTGVMLCREENNGMMV